MCAFIYDHRDEPWSWKNNELCSAISWNTTPTGNMMVSWFMFFHLSTLYFCHRCPGNWHWCGDSLNYLCIRILLEYWSKHYFQLHSLFYFLIKASYSINKLLSRRLCLPTSYANLSVTLQNQRATKHTQNSWKKPCTLERQVEKYDFIFL